METIRIWSPAFAALCWLFCATSAHADLSVHPRRLVFEGRDRSAVVTLVNNDAETHSYRIVWQALRMNADGRLVRVADEIDDVARADEMIRYAPRQVTIEPGVEQTIRLMVRKPPGLEPGEYRSHLLFVREPTRLRMGSEGDGLAISLDILYGLSIPVFVRHGDLSVEVDVESARTEPSGDGLGLDIGFRRVGTSSAYGDVSVLWKGEQGPEVVLTTVRGVGIYRETDSRRLRLDVTMPDGSAVGPGTLRVLYRAPGERGGATLAETTVAVH